MTLLAQKLYEQAMSDENPRVTKGWVKKCSILHPYNHMLAVAKTSFFCTKNQNV